MSLHPTPVDSVPPQKAAVARAVFPQGNACPRLRDRLGPIFADEQFAGLFAKTGQPAECPWRLALATLLQFGENLSDRRAADAVRSRIDWKYLLGLPLSDPGFDASPSIRTRWPVLSCSVPCRFSTSRSTLGGNIRLDGVGVPGSHRAAW